MFLNEKNIIIYINNNIYCIRIKNYEANLLNHILTSTKVILYKRLFFFFKLNSDLQKASK